MTGTKIEVHGVDCGATPSRTAFAEWPPRVDDDTFRSERGRWWARGWLELRRRDRRKLRHRHVLLDRHTAWNEEAALREYEEIYRLPRGSVRFTLMTRAQAKGAEDNPYRISKATLEFWTQQPVNMGAPSSEMIHKALDELWEKG